MNRGFGVFPFLNVFFILSFVVSSNAFAGSCDYLVNLAKDPDLAKNEAFWEAYAKLGPDVSEESLKTLAAKYKKTSPSLDSSAAKSLKAKGTSLGTTSIYQIERKHAFTKSVGRFPKHIQKHADAFIEEIGKPGGVHNLYANPGRWHLEKLGDGSYSVRLNEGYRIKFETVDSRVTLIDAGQHIYKH